MREERCGHSGTNQIRQSAIFGLDPLRLGAHLGGYVNFTRAILVQTPC